MQFEEELNRGRGFDLIFHLAAWPGVRHGQRNPISYYKNNVSEFEGVLDIVLRHRPKAFFFASSSSVYGDLGSDGPVSESDADGSNLKSFYAATKWSNEVMARSFCKIYDGTVVALRFFTVFGTYGRPDMAYWIFSNRILNGEPILLYGSNGGERNYTSARQVVEILSVLARAENLPIGYTPLNIAAGPSIETKSFLDELATNLHKTTYTVQTVNRPAEDAVKTWADTKALKALIGELPKTDLSSDIAEFCDWFMKHRE